MQSPRDVIIFGVFQNCNYFNSLTAAIRIIKALSFILSFFVIVILMLIFFYICFIKVHVHVIIILILFFCFVIEVTKTTGTMD